MTPEIARATDTQPLVIVCAWHPGFDRTDPKNKGASHGICAACLARLAQELGS